MFFTQRALNAKLMTLEDFVNVLAAKNYDIREAILAGDSHELRLFSADIQAVREYVDYVLDALKYHKLSFTKIGKVLASRLIQKQTRQYRSEVDQMWSRLSAARVINEMIQRHLLFSQSYTEHVLTETVLELGIGPVYIEHKHLNPKLISWVQQNNFAQKQDELVRISFFVLQALRSQTNDFARYRHLMKVENADRPYFDTFMREFIEQTIVDTLNMALQTRKERVLSGGETIQKSLSYAVMGGAAALIGETIIRGEPQVMVGAMAATMCGGIEAFVNTKANLNAWLAERRLRLEWRNKTQSQCNEHSRALSLMPISKAGS
jgi:hypothetical protein